MEVSLIIEIIISMRWHNTIAILLRCLSSRTPQPQASRHFLPLTPFSLPPASPGNLYFQRQAKRNNAILLWAWPTAPPLLRALSQPLFKSKKKKKVHIIVQITILLAFHSSSILPTVTNSSILGQNLWLFHSEFFHFIQIKFIFYLDKQIIF